MNLINKTVETGLRLAVKHGTSAKLTALIIKRLECECVRKKYRILIVDDVDDNRTLMRAIVCNPVFMDPPVYIDFDKRPRRRGQRKFNGYPWS